MKKLIYLSSLALIFILTACGNKGKQGVQALAEDYFASNEMAAFGKINVGEIQKLAQLDDIPLFGALITAQVDEVKKGLNMDAPIYFGVTYKDQAEVTAFASVAKKDSLQSFLEEQGYSFETVEGMLITEQDGVVMGFNDEYVAVLTGENVSQEDFTKKIIQFKSSTKKKFLEEAISHTMASNAPICFAASLGQLNNIDFNDILATKNVQIKKIAVKANDKTKNLYQYFDLQFEKGKISLNTEIIGDLTQLKKTDYIGKGNIAKNFKISGKDAMYLALNLDFSKLEANEKELIQAIVDEMDDEKLGDLAPYFSKKHPLTNIATGELTIVTQPNPQDFTKPETSFYLGTKNSDLKNKLRDMLLEVDKDAQIKITDAAIEGTMNGQNTSLSKKENMSNHYFKLHLDAHYLFNVLEMANPGSEDYVKPFKSMDITVEKTTAKLVIEVNDDSKNSLAYLVKFYSSLFLG